MKNSKEYCVILTTCGSKEEAERLAQLLVKRGLAACVQITEIMSFYTWNGRLNKEAEKLLLIKARYARYEEIEETLVENHSYEVPEIIGIRVERGLEAYFSWIDEVSR